MSIRAVSRCFPLLLCAAPLHASGFLLFQHGGRATGQAGAFVARASDPSAVRYNAAALSRLPGFQLQAGLDFQAPTDDFESGGRSDSPEHVIQFPPAIYASWRPDELAIPLTFGISLDSPFWSIQNWNPALFPGRFDTTRQELTLFELRPAVAWAIDDRWSVGGAVRYITGALETSFSTLERLEADAAHPETAEIVTETAGDADAIGFELAAHYAGERGGFGLSLSPGVELEADGDAAHFPRDPLLTEGARQEFAALFVDGGATLDFELPPTLAAGFWYSVSPWIDVEIDLAWSGWSALDRTRIGLDADPYDAAPPALDRRRDWKDVIAFRLGGEMRFKSGFSAGAGLAFEPSPVPDSTAEPGFPRGDAWMIAIGGSYELDRISFDLGYSHWLYDDRDAVLEGAGGAVPGTFGARSKVFAVSVRWRG